jgi:anti-anti-sigma factor
VPPRAHLTLQGDLDRSALPVLDDVVATLLSIEPTPEAVTIDVEDLTFIDIGGARALLGICTRLSRAVPVDLDGVTRRVARILDFVRGANPSSPATPVLSDGGHGRMSVPTQGGAPRRP